jgi:tight adherence protein B
MLGRKARRRKAKTLNDMSLISVLSFIAAALATQGLYWIAWRSRRAQSSIKRRLELSKEGGTAHGALNALRDERGLVEFESLRLRRYNDFLAQTGLRLDRNLLLLSTFTLNALLFVVVGLIFGYHAWSFMTATVFAVLCIVLFFKVVRQRRIGRFAELLPDSIDVIVRGLRAGYPLPAALDLVAKEMPDPVGTEFRLTSDEISFGQDIRAAIDNLYRRVGQDDLLFLIMAVNVQSQTGGNLAEILSSLSRLLRNRAKVKMKVRALSADGRMSAVVLSLIPFILFGLIALISPSYFGEVRDHPLIVPALIYATISLVLGNIVMYRMVNFKF